MAEPHPRADDDGRAGRPRLARGLTRAVLLTGAIFTVLLGGLFLARPAAAAVLAPGGTVLARGTTPAPRGPPNGGTTRPPVPPWPRPSWTR